MRRPAPGRGLSGRILLLTILFVLVGEVLIYIPSIARFRVVWLNERLAAAYLATVTLDEEGASRLEAKARAKLLATAEVLSITLHRPMAQLMLGEPAPAERTVDLRDPSPARLVPDALETLLAGDRTLRLIGHAPRAPRVLVDVTLREAPLRSAMLDYSVRILQLSVVLSVGVAVLLFLSLQLMIVRPLRRITAAVAAFRERPEDATQVAVEEPGRGDEIGVVEREFAEMREGLRRALVEKTRLAGLGAALGRVSHDLRNLLATAVLVSDRLETNPDPEVRRVASRLIDTLDRAVRLCAETLNYARSRPEPPVPRPVRPLQLVERLQAALVERPEPVRLRVEVDPELELMADGDQLYRVLLNLARNAYEAMGVEGGELRIASRPDAQDGLRITVADTGPGIPERALGRLFEPFAGSLKPGGTGLGLAICRELMRAQGGEIELRETSLRGTSFDLLLPARAVLREGAGPRSRAMAARRLSTLTLSLAATAGAAAALAGCGYGGPPLGGHEGLQFKVVSFYEARALEKSATCTRPRMTPVRATVVEETPERVVMNVRYHFRDEGQGNDDDGRFFPFGGGGVLGRCNDWAERTFTFAKYTRGGLEPIAMTGPQRRLGEDSAMAPRASVAAP